MIGMCGVSRFLCLRVGWKIQEVREQIDRASAGENIVPELVEAYVRDNFAYMNTL